MRCMTRCVLRNTRVRDCVTSARGLRGLRGLRVCVGHACVVMCCVVLCCAVRGAWCVGVARIPTTLMKRNENYRLITLDTKL